MDFEVARARLAEERLDARTWSSAAGDRYPEHRHAFDKALVVVAGSIEFVLPDLGSTVVLRVGDRLDLPAHTLHAAVVGNDGVTCLEAHATIASEPTALRHVRSWAAATHTPASYAAPDERPETGTAGAA